MKLKLTTITACLLLACNVVYGQDMNQPSTHGKIGITFSSFGAANVGTGGILCDCGYNADHFYTLGLNYIYPVNRWLSIETGLEYSHQTASVYSIIPGVPHIPYKQDFDLFEIPLTVRLNFLHYLFVNGGLLVDIDPGKSHPIGNQTGLGEMVGIGAAYDFNAGISLFVNPYLKLHSNIPGFSHDDSFNLYESGIRFGIAYRLRN